jgi:hypothetical protein
MHCHVSCWLTGGDMQAWVFDNERVALPHMLVAVDVLLFQLVTWDAVSLPWFLSYSVLDEDKWPPFLPLNFPCHSSMPCANCLIKPRFFWIWLMPFLWWPLFLCEWSDLHPFFSLSSPCLAMYGCQHLLLYVFWHLVKCLNKMLLIMCMHSLLSK